MRKLIDSNYMEEMFNGIGINLGKQEIYKFDLYAEYLVKCNKNINLTGITEPNEIVIKHFYDSVLLNKFLGKESKFKMIDIGAGAGFPSLPCAIINDNIELTMLDSLGKRVNFLKELTEKLLIKAECLNGRAEEIAYRTEYRENYDVATARAVTRMSMLVEYCLPFIKVGGMFFALKGFDIDEELNESTRAISELGGRIEQLDKFILPDGGKRSIISIKKISQTSTKYPRNTGKIKKCPI